jgi:hypothetical protein
MKSRAIKVLGDSANATRESFRHDELSISRIKPDSRNARTHSAKQIRQIANSIVAFGFTNPLLVNEDCELIAGFGRYEAAKQLGFEKVPVIVVDGLSPAKRRALAIADNKIAQNSRWDRERLAIEIPELADLLTPEGLDVSILGFEPTEMDHIQMDFEERAILKTESTPSGVRPAPSASSAICGCSATTSSSAAMVALPEMSLA